VRSRDIPGQRIQVVPCDEAEVTSSAGSASPYVDSGWELIAELRRPYDTPYGVHDADRWYRRTLCPLPQTHRRAAPRYL